MPRIVVVPGLAVRRYLEPAVDRLRSQGADVRLYRPPAWSGRESVEQLSRELADDLSGAPVDLLVGLSVGTYVAAGAAAVAPANQRSIVLVSPVEANSWRALGLADGQRVTIPRAGHSWPYHDPGGFARTMLGLA